MLSHNSLPLHQHFFVIKNWNDETRTAITVHSPPLSPMHEQVTNKQKNEVFQNNKELTIKFTTREKKKKYKNN